MRRKTVSLRAPPRYLPASLRTIFHRGDLLDVPPSTLHHCRPVARGFKTSTALLLTRLKIALLSPFNLRKTTKPPPKPPAPRPPNPQPRLAFQ